jgi:sirohydrochlorin cobaltochelatase
VNALEPSVGILLVGHGTRDLSGLAEMRRLTAHVAEAMAPQPVEMGFIELAQPTIASAFDRLVQLGADQIGVVPLLLFAAGHAKTDVPQAIRQAASVHGHVKVTVAPPLGLDDSIAVLSRRRFEEAVVNWPRVGADEIYWLLVGRGSSDPEAIAAFGRFAGRQAGRLGLPHYGCAFVAAAQPTLESGLERAVRSVPNGVQRIVVQPHLLFRGAVLDEVDAAVALWQARYSKLEWITCAHLGPEQELVDAVIERSRGTIGNAEPKREI